MKWILLGEGWLGVERRVIDNLVADYLNIRDENGG
jgi:hypothetical protein